jgi:hypothetical protein
MRAYDDITKLCRQQAEVIPDHENEHDIENITGLNVVTVKLQVTRLPL